jgi:hypothetical protein
MYEKQISKNQDFNHRSDTIKLKVIKWLLNGKMSFDLSVDAIGNEVLFSQARRRADLLILSKKFHALEIKGDSDNLVKLSEQLKDYQQTFDRVSVVTTKKHYAKLFDIVPHNVGIMLIEDDKIRIKRKPIANKELDKLSLLTFLDKPHLVKLLSERNGVKYTDELRLLASKQILTKTIRETAYQRLKEKYLPLFQRFLKEFKDYPIQIDDIRSLSAEVSATFAPKSKGGAELHED